MKNADVIQKAKRIADKYNPERYTPFPFLRLANSENISIYAKDLNKEKISGGIDYDKKTRQFRIIVNSKESPRRQNFTIAHELGHYFLHRDEIKKSALIDHGVNELALYRGKNDSDIEKELEADLFAANLLMPEKEVERIWKLTKDVIKCADVFSVSTVAMSRRLQDLGIIDG